MYIYIHIPCRSVIGKLYPIIYSSVEQPISPPTRVISKSSNPGRAANGSLTVKALISQAKCILYFAIERLKALLLVKMYIAINCS